MGLPGSPPKHSVSAFNIINHTGTPAAADAAAATKHHNVPAYNFINHTGTPAAADAAAKTKHHSVPAYNFINHTGTPAAADAAVAATKHHRASNYNPINHTGTPAAADAAAAAKHAAGCGSKYAGASAAKSNLHGSACMPKQGAAGSETKASTRPDSLLHLPARVDHLQGTACIAASSRSLQHGGNGGSGSSDSSGCDSMSDHSGHTAHKAKLLTLRAAVDHLAGEGCTVRQVDVVATLDAPPPSVSRGMATRLVRDRQIARTAHEHNMSSVLYQPGQGYTKVVSG